MSRPFAWSVIILAALALLGCAGGASRSGEPGEVAELLAYYERLTRMAPDAQRREYAAAQAAYEQQPGDAARLRLALLMALPRAAWRDDARLLSLLGGMKPVPAGEVSPRRELALLIEKIVGERQRQVREEQRKAEEAEQKVNALRSIDREMRPRKPSP